VDDVLVLWKSTIPHFRGGLIGDRLTGESPRDCCGPTTVNRPQRGHNA
jgi:hypothetical protein